MNTELVLCAGCGQELEIEDGSLDAGYACPSCLTPVKKSRAGGRGPEPVPISGSSPYVRQLRCSFHPGVAAIRRCELCKKLLCTTCVLTRNLNHRRVEVCPCGGRVERLTPLERGIKPVTFQQTLGTAFAYPVEGQGAVMLFLGTLFFTGVGYLFRIPIIGWFFLFLTLAYVSAFMAKIIFTTALGRNEPPEWPEMARMGQTIFMPFFLGSVTAVLCGGPAAAYLHFTGSMDGVFLVLAVIGGFFFPMGLACVAVSGTPAALNPFFWLNAIFMVPGDYLMASFTFFLACGLKAGGEVLSSQIPYVGSVFGTFMLLYFLMVEMRILGLIFQANKGRIGWV